MNFSLLQKLVEESKLSKATIAKRSEISRTTLDAAIGGADIKISTIEKLANVLGVNSSVFFTEPQPDGNTATASGQNSTAIAGNANSVTAPASLDKAIDEIAAQRKMNEKSQEQIDRLLGIIENMNKN